MPPATIALHWQHSRRILSCAPQYFLAYYLLVWNTICEIGESYQTLGIRITTRLDCKGISNRGSVGPGHRLGVDAPILRNNYGKRPVRAQIKLSPATGKNGENDTANVNVDFHMSGWVQLYM